MANSLVEVEYEAMAKSDELNRISTNGVIQVDNIDSDYLRIFSNINVVYCKTNRFLYRRVKDGISRDCWK
jgi:hypothetical protein